MDKLINMFAEDQNLRMMQIVDEKGLQELSKKQVESIKPWVLQHGWDVTGQEEIYLFTIVIHADHDVEFQEHCLNLMRTGSKNQQLMAFLEDRILVNKGMKQKYGTQVNVNFLGMAVPEPIEDKTSVDVRRMSIGLEPLSSYLRKIEDSYA